MSERTAIPSGPAETAARHVLRRSVQKELREVIRDGRFWIVALSVAALLVVALAFGLRQTASVRAERAAAQRTADAHFVAQDAKNPHAAAHYGTHVFKPGGPLPFLDPGIEPFVGVSVELVAHRRGAFDGARARDSTALARFGRLSVAAVLQLLVPLLVVGIGFSAWAAERERGTLRLIASSGVRSGTLALGKALGLAAALGALLLPAILLCAVVLAIAGDGTGPVPFDRLAALVFAYSAYFAVLLASTLGVSALTRSSRGALVALLSAWIVAALVVPRAAADAAGSWVSTPAPATFAEGVRRSLEQGLPEGPTREARVDELTERLMAEEGYQGAETLMDGALLAAIELRAEAEFENEVLDHHFQQIGRAIERQERAIQWAAVVSPVVAIRSLSMALSGTDYGHHRHFSDAAERFRRQLVDALNRELAKEGGRDVWAYRADRETWERMPKFEYEPPEVGWALRQQIVSASLLLAWLAGSIFFAVRAARGIRVV